MKLRYMMYALLLMQGLYASTYTLDRVLESTKKHGVLTKAQYYERLSLEAKNRADTAGDPFSLTAEGTHAAPHLDKSGTEYSIGLSKKIMMPGVLSQEQRITQLSNDAYMLEKEMELLDFENGLKNLYHQYCLDVQNYRSFRASYLDFVKLYKKKQKAYLYQEISKMELIQLETEKNRLNAQLQALKMQQSISRRKLLILGSIPEKETVVFSCQDMYPVRRKVDYTKSLSLSKKAYKKRIQSTEETLKRYSRAIESIDTYAQYTNELDTERYSIGISIPLNFTSRRFEEERAAAMYKNSALQYKFEQHMRQKQSALMELHSQLQSHALMIDALRKNEYDYTKKLFPMVQKSFDLGEISVLEYLMNRQKLYQIRQAIYAEKEAYYTTLFRLYTISETKDKK
ncbi:TolC family protein [Sulfurovum sp. ST-21]|uniref:TolC family protein n=1 Tax=Sulfurovum indicum TaxID=2779528 RepID=A0A7M1S3F3_9BACT|nr:TolC family protein [Sulfurovum indicum]QOR61967.1 TolC family protein [Sulfurovum indicum]